MFKTLLTTSALLLTGVAALAAPAGTKPNAAKAPAALTCPVTGETIASIKDAAGQSTYKGKTYYFCCSSCKPAFDKNPQKYIKKTAAAPAKPSSAQKS